VRSASLALTKGKSNVSRKSPSATGAGKSSPLGGRLDDGSDNVSAASTIPGSVDAELASAWDTTKRKPQRGHFNRLPDAT
jgi:hypothetical protein